MKKLLLTIVAATALCGCVNLYTRMPGTRGRINSVYQSTSTAFSLGFVVMFPQIMSDNPGDGGFMWENCFTIPLGLMVEVDMLLEAVIDTVCLPVDWPLSNARQNAMLSSDVKECTISKTTDDRIEITGFKGDDFVMVDIYDKAGMKRSFKVPLLTKDPLRN